VLKIFLVSGLGYIIGELKHDFKNNYILKNAGVVRTAGQDKVVIAEPIMPWMANQMEQIKEFSLSKHLVIAQDDANGLDEVYGMYVQELVKKRSGLHLV